MAELNINPRNQEVDQMDLDAKIRWSDYIPVVGPRNYSNRTWKYCGMMLSDDESLREKYKTIQHRERGLQLSSDTTIGALIGVGSVWLYQYLNNL